MATSDQRIPANKVALLFMVLLGIWVGWLFLPKSEKPKVNLPPVVTESKLRAVGLSDNPDWDGLPEFFAVWADHAGWKDDKVQFAYWNPGSNSYSYFFEAIRKNGKIWFRSLSKAEFGVGASAFFEETDEWNKEGRPTQFESPEHPFFFFEQLFEARGIHDPPEKAYFPKEKPLMHVPIELKSAPLPSPEIVVKKPQEADAGQKK